MTVYLLTETMDEQSLMSPQIQHIHTFNDVKCTGANLVLCTSSYLTESDDAALLYAALQKSSWPNQAVLIMNENTIFSYHVHTTLLSFLRYMSALIVPDFQLQPLTGEQNELQAVRKIFQNQQVTTLYLYRQRTYFRLTRDSMSAKDPRSIQQVIAELQQG